MTFNDDTPTIPSLDGGSSLGFHVRALPPRSAPAPSPAPFVAIDDSPAVELPKTSQRGDKALQRLSMIENT